MSRPATSLTVALWGAVLGCCVWGVHVSQAAAHAAGVQHVIGAQEARETGKQQDLTRSLASLVYWSDLLQARTADLGKLPLYPAADTLASEKDSCDTESCPARFCESAQPMNPFVATRNRWSHGFH